MEPQNKRSNVLVIIILVIVLAVLTGILMYIRSASLAPQKTGGNQSVGNQQSLLVPEADWNTKFKAAVADAKDAKPDEIDKNLMAITPENNKLVRDGAGRILVMAFTSYSGYDDKVNSELPLSKEIWITTVPELENFCQQTNLGSMDTAVRIEQLLGLPAGQSTNKRFVALWVSPDDLYRPCADPEINDSQCELDYPKSPYTTISADYRTWFEHQKSISYLDDGFPWTRLGYTYDWGGADDIGLSEFIVKPGATVKVDGIWPTDKYILEKCGVTY